MDTIFLKIDISNLDGAVVVTLLKNGQTTNFGFTQKDVTGNLRNFIAVFDDPQMAAGSYTIRIQAYNGENRSSEFLPINYQEADLTRTGFACILLDGTQKQLGWLPENGSLKAISLTGDFPYLTVNPFTGEIIIAPAFSGKLSAYDKFLNLLYEVPNPVPSGSLQYRQLINDNQMAYALDNDGYIKAYQQGQTPARNYRLSQGKIPLRAAFSATDEFLVAAAEPGFNQFKLLLLNPVNGNELQTSHLPEFPIGVAYAGSHFYILCAKSDTSIIYQYSTQSRQLTELHKISGEVPTDMASVGGNTCYIATDKGLYGIFTTNPNQPIPISQRLSGLAISDLSGTLKDDELYFSSGNSIYVCNETVINLLYTINGKQISALEAHYNK